VWFDIGQMIGLKHLYIFSSADLVRFLNDVGC